MARNPFASRTIEIRNQFKIGSPNSERVCVLCMSELCLRSGAYIVMRGLRRLFNFIESDEIHRYVGKT